MNLEEADCAVDVVIVGAGPVGLMCACLAQLCGLRTVVLDQSDGPLQVGRADALNARSLQLLEIVGLFKELYPLGKTCNTSSVWAAGQFISRQSSWWDELEGCEHKHFLMLGQSYLEKLLDAKLRETGAGVRRHATVTDIELVEDSSDGPDGMEGSDGDAGCITRLSCGESIRSKYVIGADGSRSFVRQHFEVPFEIVRPQLVWAVVDGVIDSDFPKVPEIIVFQSETSDVAWVPREGDLDRFYVRMDTKEFTLDQAIEKINRAMQPHTLRFKDIVWFSQFSVKESVAEHFSVQNRIFLAGDACHIHSVNGGQGLNTGLGDAFNLMWKLNGVINFGLPPEFLRSYEEERKPVALSVVGTSGELVRSTQDSQAGTHAQDYVEIVRKRAGNITGMGIRYGESGLRGTRLHDFEIHEGTSKTRIYSLLNYTQFTLLVFSGAGDRGDLANGAELKAALGLPEFIRVVQISADNSRGGYWAENSPYLNQAVLVRPDSYIESVTPLHEMESIS
ncbi:MAG: FAD-binding protein [Methylotenera sp.]|nr:FAD-binding protein [Oligoflexia bacterium]